MAADESLFDFDVLNNISNCFLEEGADFLLEDFSLAVIAPSENIPLDESGSEGEVNVVNAGATSPKKMYQSTLNNIRPCELILAVLT